MISNEAFQVEILGCLYGHPLSVSEEGRLLAAIEKKRDERKPSTRRRLPARLMG